VAVCSRGVSEGAAPSGPPPRARLPGTGSQLAQLGRGLRGLTKGSDSTPRSIRLSPDPPRPSASSGYGVPRAPRQGVPVTRGLAWNRRLQFDARRGRSGRGLLPSWLAGRQSEWTRGASCEHTRRGPRQNKRGRGGGSRSQVEAGGFRITGCRVSALVSEAVFAVSCCQLA